MTGTAPDAIEVAWASPPAEPVDAEVRKALVALGFQPAEAGRAVAAARAHVGERPAVDALLREALKQCPKPRP